MTSSAPALQHAVARAVVEPRVADLRVPGLLP